DGGGSHGWGSSSDGPDRGGSAGRVPGRLATHTVTQAQQPHGLDDGVPREAELGLGPLGSRLGGEHPVAGEARRLPFHPGGGLLEREMLPCLHRGHPTFRMIVPGDEYPHAAAEIPEPPGRPERRGGPGRRAVPRRAAAGPYGGRGTAAPAAAPPA